MFQDSACVQNSQTRSTEYNLVKEEALEDQGHGMVKSEEAEKKPIPGKIEEDYTYLFISSF